MSLSDLPKLWTEPTKIGHISRKQSNLKQSFHKISFIKVDLLVKYSSEKKKNSERFGWFLMPKNDFESTNFEKFEEVFHNFGRSDNDMS